MGDVSFIYLKYSILLLFIQIPTSTLGTSALTSFLNRKLHQNGSVWHPSDWAGALMHLLCGPLQSKPSIIYYDESVTVEQWEDISEILSSAQASFTFVNCQTSQNCTKVTSDPGLVSLLFFNNEPTSPLFDETAWSKGIHYLLLVNLAYHFQRQNPTFDVLERETFSRIRSVALISQQIHDNEEIFFI